MGRGWNCTRATHPPQYLSETGRAVRNIVRNIPVPCAFRSAPSWRRGGGIAPRPRDGVGCAGERRRRLRLDGLRATSEVGGSPLG
jgi:hypothetical protein